ncbi:MAG TPA: VOC family protein [Trinickia sp.]|uniref:VOC family protein n=1 Tax=Trinickia sp. TaxID=2571163 RepID=UPI002B8E1CED|nr:VOC family protein [Trinickia sp.]HTI17519.1 VOC family protein [Trinickia sp.]
MIVQPYLFFDGRCEEALAFYREKLGAQVLFQLRAKDAPGDHAIEGEHGERIMHASFRIGETTLMASDGKPDEPPTPHSGFSLSVSATDAAEGQRMFDALATGGEVSFPWQKTFWTEGFGMLTDQFGIPWMVNVAHEESKA